MRRTDIWDEVTQHLIDEWICASTTPKQVMIKHKNRLERRIILQIMNESC